ncbi:MAG: iron-sulfur cluster assembly scaffold protein [Patescibacteria group bacterium]
MEDFQGDELYRENILDHYRHPHNTGVMEQCTHRAREVNPLCGDEIEIFLRFDEVGKAANVSFVGQGCAISQAVVSMLTDWVKGKSREELARADETYVRQWLGAPVSVSREKCAFLGLRALRRAIDINN